jgi:multidrug efflux pump
MIIGMNGNVPVLLGDVASVNLIDDDKESKIRVDGQNAVLVPIFKTPDGNNLSVANAVYAMIAKVNKEIRGQAEVTIESDHSIFVRESLHAIFRTIVEACVLVILIIFLFLRHLMATLVPLVTIPISLIATFFAMKIFGLSINTVTLLAMVLAVGLVVDDAIVVLENIFRYREQGLGALEAAKKGTSEIGFAIVAMTCTLMSVFLPLAFVSDITGAILREFAITLASAVFFSGIVALTLSPLMCAHLLKHQKKDGRIATLVEKAIKKIEGIYQELLIWSFAKRRFVFIGALIFLGAGIFLYQRLPSDLLPKEDRGMIGARIAPVSGFDLDDMEPYVAQVEQIFLQRKEIEKLIVFAFPGGVNVVSVLKPWAQRSIHAEKIVAAIRVEVASIPSINVYPWSWDVGLSALEDTSHDRANIALALMSVGSYERLEAVAQELVNAMHKDGIVKDARSDLDMNEKSYSIKMLREPLAALGIDEKMVSLALQIYADRMWSSEFKLAGQRYDVFLSTDVVTDDLSSIYITTKNGDAVPLSTIAKVKTEVQAPVLKHLNQMRTATVLANLGKGQSLSDAKIYLDKLVQEHVPKDVSVSYEGIMAMQKRSGQTFILLFLAGLIFIFAVMAIQFEGIIDPLIILLTVPLACVGGALMLWLSRNGTNIYTQVGMLTLIGLITKHGILLTEFVSRKRKEGLSLQEAVFLAAKLRFRPIMMTTAAMVLGALPLVFTGGAGNEARVAIGLVIVGGMIFGTILTLFVLPSSIYAIHSFKDR